ncbi:MAG: hypothetical protein E6I88_12955 [Chloroflexi bacterium]|nr:MAG: hypothetical protein E6I88_12955 [Chloroflexota bacterium]
MLLRLILAAATAAALTAALTLVVFSQPGCGYGADTAACTRVLFIGNSYTSVNDLPATFAKLGRSGGHRVETGRDTVDGSTLADHAASAATATALAGARWNIVVLQEQSQIPAIDQLRQSDMYPAARTLVAMVRHAGQHPIFFMTWAHEYGWPENGLADYGAMQTAINQGYLSIAQEEGWPSRPSELLGRRRLRKKRSPPSGKTTAATRRCREPIWRPASSTPRFSGRAQWD